MKAIVSTKTKYSKEAVPALAKDAASQNALSLASLERIVVHVGIGKVIKDTAAIKEVVETLRAITGQAPVKTLARKSIAGFKVREGQEIGVMVTLRGQRMWDFLDRLVHIALPRTRDFQGITLSSVDSCGNLNIGIREHTVFPEISPEKAQRIFGLQVTVKTSATTQAEGLILFRALGVPLKKD